METMGEELMKLYGRIVSQQGNFREVDMKNRPGKIITEGNPQYKIVGNYLTQSAIADYGWWNMSTTCTTTLKKEEEKMEHGIDNKEDLVMALDKEEKQRRTDMTQKIVKLKRDISALDKSIVEKWIPIWRGNKIDQGASDCALCRIYHGATFGHGYCCYNCPINEDCGGCNGSPYRAWDDVCEKGQLATTQVQKDTAWGMVVYLGGLSKKLQARKEILEVKEKERVELKLEEERKKNEAKGPYPYVFYLTLDKPVESLDDRLELERLVKKLFTDRQHEVINSSYSYGDDSFSGALAPECTWNNELKKWEL